MAALVILFVTAMLVLLPAPRAVAAECELPEGYRSNERPGPDGEPTALSLGVLVADVTNIDDINQAMEVDIILRKTWTDPRLAALAGCRLQRASIWFPVIDVLNSNHLDRIRGRFGADQVRVAAGGVVHYTQRFFGTVATYHRLNDFPFDEHRIRVRLGALDNPVDEVRIELDESFTGIAALLNIPDWTIELLESEVVTEEVPEFETVYSLAHLDVIAKRNSSFYIYKVMLPLTLIVLMSFTVFWVTPERFGPQIGISATAMLTLIAFQFALTTVLPKVSYFTTMDRLILGSTALVFAALVEATATTSLVIADRTEVAVRIDRTCRWLFPLAHVVLWAVVLS